LFYYYLNYSFFLNLIFSLVLHLLYIYTFYQSPPLLYFILLAFVSIIKILKIIILILIIIIIFAIIAIIVIAAVLITTIRLAVFSGDFAVTINFIDQNLRKDCFY
jgi:hypothetical protein